MNYGALCFRPLSGHLISKSCLPEPAILLAFLTLLRGKSFSCIFFLYLTYTIASKCSIYAVRGKIFFFSNEPLHTPILTHISHICIEIWYFQSNQSVNPPFSHLLLTDCSFSPNNCFFTSPAALIHTVPSYTFSHSTLYTSAHGVTHQGLYPCRAYAPEAHWSFGRYPFCWKRS